jgi:hypothetical protein
MVPDAHINGTIHLYYSGCLGPHGDLYSTLAAETLAAAKPDYGRYCPDSVHCQGGGGSKDDWGFGSASATYSPSLERFSLVRTMVYKRGALMRATWTKGRLWGLVPAAGMELPGVVLTKSFADAKGKRLIVNAQTVRGGKLLAELQSDGHPIEGFSLSDCLAFEGDEEAFTMSWAGGTVVPAVAVQLKFMLYDARLWTFELQ